jgi:hypothetical protein
MRITSVAFADGGTIPPIHVMPGAGGRNISVPLAWNDLPAGTRSLALSLVDPHPVARNWVHWLVVNLPPDAAGLAEGASGDKMPAGARELKNSWGKPGYGGPQPPAGSGIHPYVFTLYALSVEKLDLKADAGLAAFEAALDGHILASAKITGYFGQ